MLPNFEAIWLDISGQLRPGRVIKNWSANKGFTGRTFQINEVERAAITVSSENTVQDRRISKGDFQKVYALWPAYKAGVLRRSDLITKSQNTTYILSILHWLELSKVSVPLVPER